MSDTSVKDMAELQKKVGTDGVLDVLERNQKVIQLNGDKRQVNGSHSFRSRNPKADLPPIIDVMDFLEEDIPEPPPLIESVLAKGSKLILSGGSKTRKTWALTHLAVAVASGTPWWGFPTKRGKVLYINFEIQKGYYQRRVKAIKDHLLIEGAKLRGNLHIWNLRGYAADISDLVEQIIQAVGDKFDLVIFDPIYKILGDRDENSNGEVADMMNEFDRIIEATGAAVAFAHHYSKGNQAKKDVIDRMSGAGAFARDADSLLFMTPHTQPDTYTIDTIFRNYAHIEQFCVRVEHPIMVRDEQSDPSKVKGAKGNEKKFVVADLLKVLNIQHITRADLLRQFSPKVASSGTFNTLFKEAQDSEAIELCEDGKKWKAVAPVYPPGWKAGNSQPEGNGTTVQD